MLRLLCVAMLAAGCLTPYDDLEVGPRSSIELAPRSRVQLHAYGVRADGAREDITDLVRWSSTDRQIVTVTETGTVEWVAAGPAQIRAVYYNLGVTVALTAADPSSRSQDLAEAGP